MTIQQQVVLRFRASGHVRFGLPAPLCRPGAAERLVAGLQNTAGIYRVDLSGRQKKLSIRYDHRTIDFKRIAQALAAVIGEIERSPGLLGNGGTELRAVRGASILGKAGSWAGNKAQEFRETVAAFRIVMRNTLGQHLRTSPEKSKFISEFLTDILVLYLIKAHWQLITQHWLKRPWQHRYEWTAALYMIYLLVSSKKPKP